MFVKHNLTTFVKHNLTILVKHNLTMFVSHNLTIIVKHGLTIFINNDNKLNQPHISGKSCATQLEAHKHEQPPYH